MNPLIFLKECASTNDEILKYFTLKDFENLAVYTFNQTKGKGQYGNSWELGENLNLAFTIAVPTELIQSQDYLFNFYTAVVLADFLAKLTKNKIEIKWPNDLIINNKKISGLLIEKKNIQEIPYFIIGIGLNVLQENFQHLPKAGSLLTQTGLKLNIDELAISLHEYLTKHLTKNFSEEELLVKLNRNLFRKDMVSVFGINEVRQNGIIKKVDDEGFLWVDLEKDGLQKFYHKEIELLY